MNQEKVISQIVQEVMKQMNAKPAMGPYTTKEGTLTSESYPLGEKAPEKLFTPTGINLKDVTFDKLIDGKVGPEDIRISPETLEMQAQVSDSIGRVAFAKNLRRAAELIAVPDERILEIYNLLRPYRSTKAELYAVADELESKYGCKINAEFVREAAAVYEGRDRLKKD